MLNISMLACLCWHFQSNSGTSAAVYLFKCYERCDWFQFYDDFVEKINFQRLETSRLVDLNAC